MATQLETVNRVLRRLREDQVGTVNETTYSTLIGEFVNAGIEDVQDAHDWNRLVRTTYADTVGGAQAILSSFDVDGGNAYGNTMTETSKMRWLNQDDPTILWSDEPYPTPLSKVSDWYPLTPITLEQWETLQTVNSSGFQGKVDQPSLVCINSTSSEALNAISTTALLWPYTKTDGMLKIVHWKPQGTFELDGTDDNQDILAPVRPVFEYALMMALNERGEEIGEPGNMAERRYFDAISKAIEQDLDWDQRTNKFDWRRD